jgi:hypothetical protein
MLDVFLVVNFAGKLYANFLCDFACNIIAVERCLVAKPARIAETYTGADEELILKFILDSRQ